MFVNIYKNLKIWYCCKAIAEWDIKVENIIEEQRIKTYKNEDENFQFLSKITTICKIWSQKS